MHNEMGGRLQPGDVGHRVVVRRFVGIGPQNRPTFSDLLGELLAIDARRLVIRTHDGAEHAVPAADVVAAKRVPPRPVKYSEIAALELVADAAWPAPVHEHLGQWILRAADGWTGRANSALPIGDSGRPLDQTVDVVQRWYEDRRLPAMINVPLPLRRDVSDALTKRAWPASPPNLVQVASLSDMLTDWTGGDPAQLSLETTLSAEFLAIAAARKRSLPGAARHVLTAVPHVRFAEVRDEGGALVAMARGAVIQDWLHVGLVEVDPSRRRGGLGRRVSQALARWAAETGATRAVLQVEEHNTAAVNLYAGLGFATHHHYVSYRSP
jgi:ribosomal protein S18 acetylase RimI-like enzyme